MNKFILCGVACVFLACLPVFADAAPDVPPPSYSETLPQSAFQAGDVEAAVRMLLKEKVPISEIIKAAIQSGVSNDAIIGALLAAGIPPEKIVLYCLEGPIPFTLALGALNNNGIPPDDVLTWLIKWKISIEDIYETCDFMLKHGYSQADLLRTLSDAGASREIVVQVVRWFDIPPATVIAVYQSLLDYFGHVFNRHSLPQPALLAIGVARITIEDQSRPVISPMRP